MKVELTLSSVIGNLATTIAATTVPRFRVTPRFGYCQSTQDIGTGTTAMSATSTDTSGVGPISDGAGLVEVNSILYSHHVNSVVHLSPGYKYFYYFTNDVVSDLNAIFATSSRALHVAFKFIGMLEHLLTFVTLEEMPGLVARMGPIHAPSDTQCTHSLQARLKAKMDTGWTPDAHFAKYLTDGKESTRAPQLSPPSDSDDHLSNVKAPQTTTPSKPPDDDYLSKVKKLNKLQTELDELESVLAPKVKSLNC